MNYRDLIISHRPRAYWPFDEPSGTNSRDLSGNAFDGTYTNTGGLTYNVESARPTGQRGINFSSTAYMQPPSGSRQTGKNFSRECWVKTTDTSGSGQFLVAQYGAANGEDYWVLNGNGTYRVFMFNGGFIYDQNGVGDTTRAPQDARNHHLAYTRADAGLVRVYWDGFPVISASGGTSANTLLNTSNNEVGRAVPDAGANFIGVLSDVAIYDYELSPSQVLEHFRNGRGVQKDITPARSRMR